MCRFALIVVIALAAAAPAAAPMPPAAGRARRAAVIATTDGRQVLLRGVNVNQIGDYWQQRADIPQTLPLTEPDFAEIHALGQNVVRLLMDWSRLEPERGRFDSGYLAQIKAAVGWARRNGIYVVLDTHQGAWGKYIASPKDETCPPGFSRQQGWEGAPKGATLAEGLPTCRFQIREIAPAVGQGWQSFYRDRDGIQSELVKTWAYLARAFASEPAVAGYDLLNEPRRILARPYVRVAPGRTASLRSDAGTATMSAAGEDSERRGSCRIEAWVPRAVRPAASGSGVRRLRVVQQPGGWSVVGSAPGQWRIGVTRG